MIIMVLKRYSIIMMMIIIMVVIVNNTRATNTHNHCMALRLFQNPVYPD